jgi:hypothetical protein
MTENSLENIIAAAQSQDPVDNIYTLMALAMNEVRSVGKDGEYRGGASGHFNFRGIDAVMNAVGPAFRKWGIVGPVPQLLELVQDRVPTGKDGKPTNRSTVKVKFSFYGPAADHIDCITPGEGFDFGDKATAKAMSVAARIALLQALCLPTDEPDPDSEAYEQVEKVESEVDIARGLLVSKMKALKLDPMVVIARYGNKFDGADPRTDTDVARIRDFTADLGLADQPK